MPSQLTARCSGPISLVLYSLREDAIPHPSNMLYLQLWVLHFMLRLVEFWFIEAVCDSQRSVSHEQHGELELGDEFTWKKMRLKSCIKLKLKYIIWLSNVSVNGVETDVDMTVLLSD